MFERNRIDNSSPQQMTVPVEVTLENGDCVRGKFVVPSTRTLFDVLNNSGSFVEFEPYGGERSIIAKSAIKAVRIVNVPVAPNLASRTREVDPFDPFTVLGLARGAGIEEARAAYHRLAKLYHPDRYSGVDLPAEVQEYLAAVARRINAAYAALEEAAQVRKTVAERARPIYTSPPRA